MNDRLVDACARLCVAFVAMTSVMQATSVARLAWARDSDLFTTLIVPDTYLPERLFLWRDAKNIALVSEWTHVAAAIMILAAVLLYRAGRKANRLWFMPLGGVTAWAVAGLPVRDIITAISPLFLGGPAENAMAGYGIGLFEFTGLVELESVSNSIMSSGVPYMVVARAIGTVADLGMAAAHLFALAAAMVIVYLPFRSWLERGDKPVGPGVA